MELLDLTVGYDAKRALFNNTGLGNYSRLVVGLMAERHPDWQLGLYSPRDAARASERAAGMLAMPNVDVRCPDGKFGRMLPSLWRSVAGMGRQVAADGVRLFHGLSGELPPDLARFPQVKSVVTVHDLIFRRCPENYSAIDRRIYDRKFRHAVGQATLVMAISECTRRDIIEFYDADPSKIMVVRQGCHEIFSRPVGAEAVAEVRKRYGLPGRYIVAVGTVEVRKNQGLAVKALPALPKDVALVIVGGDHGRYSAELEALAAKLGVADRVVRLRGVPLADLPALYAGAAFSSYTSRYEGFGLPLVESLSCSTPVIAATGSCLEEAGGDGALYVAPDDVDAYVGASLRLLDSPEERNRLVEAGRRHVATLSGDAFAAGIEAVYAEALRR